MNKEELKRRREQKLNEKKNEEPELKEKVKEYKTARERLREQKRDSSEGSSLSSKTKGIIVGLFLFVVAILMFVFMSGGRQTDYTADLESRVVEVNAYDEFEVHGVTDAPADKLTVHFDGRQFRLDHYNPSNGYFAVSTSADPEHPATTQFELRYDDQVVISETLELHYPMNVEEDKQASNKVKDEKEPEKKDDKEKNETNEENNDSEDPLNPEELSSAGAGDAADFGLESFVSKPGEHDDVIADISKEVTDFIGREMGLIDTSSDIYNAIEAVERGEYLGNREFAVIVDETYEQLLDYQKDHIVRRVGVAIRLALRREEHWTAEDEQGSFTMIIRRDKSDKEIERFKFNEYEEKSSAVMGDGSPMLKRKDVKFD